MKEMKKFVVKGEEAVGYFNGEVYIYGNHILIRILGKGSEGEYRTLLKRENEPVKMASMSGEELMNMIDKIIGKDEFQNLCKILCENLSDSEKENFIFNRKRYK